MPLEEPSWWYGPDASDWRVRALRPASGVYAWAAQRRFRERAGYRSRLPVICVGNFTAGGTGKTPLSMDIARRIVAAGGAPAFLTRGYSGRTAGPVWVNGRFDTAEEVGDEPLLLARTAPTLVSRDREAGAKAIEAERRATHIVMDDGMQNPSLVKSLTVAVVDGRRGLGNGEVIPAGPLRAPLEFQFALADAIVVNGGTADGSALEALKAAFPGPVLAARIEPDRSTTDALEAREIVAFSGIGHPARFFDLLGSVGAETVAERRFKDHHTFSEADAVDLLSLSKRHGATLVTTAKDRARLSGLAGARGELAQAVHVVEIRLTFEPRDEDRLVALIANAQPVD